MSPRVLIAEDEAPQRAALRGMLAEQWPELELCAECEDGLAALEALQSQRPQLAILDIRMPGLSGVEVARAAIEQGCQVIFTTAYDEYAVRAFEAGAIDYLLKPVRPERLASALKRVRERLATPLVRALPELLSQHRRYGALYSDRRGALFSGPGQADPRAQRRRRSDYPYAPA